jgi:hypothetical protein
MILGLTVDAWCSLMYWSVLFISLSAPWSE